MDLLTLKRYETVIQISDLQYPFEHPDSHDFLAALKSKYFVNKRKSIFIGGGDEVDFHALGRWEPDPDGYSPGHEVERAKAKMHELYELVEGHIHFCISNHTMRPWIKRYSAGLPSTFVKSIPEVLEAPKGVKWVQRIVLKSGPEEILFEHGENVSGINAGLNAAKQNNMNTVICHQHVNGGVQYASNFRRTLWGLNGGCLIDQTKYAFNYARKSRNKVTLGTGVVVEGIPYFIPMLLKSNGRWIGRL